MLQLFNKKGCIKLFIHPYNMKKNFIKKIAILWIFIYRLTHFLVNYVIFFSVMHSLDQRHFVVYI